MFVSKILMSNIEDKAGANGVDKLAEGYFRGIPTKYSLK